MHKKITVAMALALVFAASISAYGLGDKSLSPEGVTYQNRNYLFRGDYFTEESFDAITIGSERVRLKNKTTTGDVTINQIVNEGVVTLENMDIGGTLYIYGGSEVNLKGVRAQRVVINAPDITVKLNVEDKSDIAVLEVITGAIVEENHLSSGYGGIKAIETTKSPLTALPLSLKYCRLDSLTIGTPTVITDLGKNKITTVTANFSLRLLSNDIEIETQSGSIILDTGN